MSYLTFVQFASPCLLIKTVNLEDEDSAFSDNKPMSVLTSRSEDPDVQLAVVLLYRRASFYGASLGCTT